MAIILRAFQTVIHSEFQGVARACLEKGLVRELELRFLIFYEAVHGDRLNARSEQVENGLKDRIVDINQYMKRRLAWGF